MCAAIMEMGVGPPVALMMDCKLYVKMKQNLDLDLLYISVAPLQWLANVLVPLNVLTFVPHFMLQM